MKRSAKTKPKVGRGILAEAQLRTCRWCGHDFFATIGKQRYCPGTSHRVYRSKRRTKELERFWEEAAWIFSDHKISYERARAAYNKDAALRLASRLGFYYSDALRHWTMVG